MELQFLKTPCSCLNQAAWEVKNTEVTQEIRLSDGMPDIGRVLASWGQVIVRSKEWRGNMVTVAGGVMVWALYAPEDGTEPRALNAWIPFQQKWDLSVTDREGPIRVCSLLRFVDSRTVSARKIMVRAGIATLGEMLYPFEAEVFTPHEIPADVELLRRTYPVHLPRESGEKTFLQDEDLTVSGHVPDKIIAYTMQPEITDQKVMANKVVFRGNGNLHLVYYCKEGRIRTQDFELPFSQFADLEGEYGTDARADMMMGITSLELDLNEEGQLRLKCGLLAQYLVSDRTMLELVEDGYSPHRAVSIHQQPLILPAILDEGQERITAESTAAGVSGQVADVSFLPDFPRIMKNGEQLEMELPGVFQILYYGEDDALQSASARWEGRWNQSSAEDSMMHSTLQPVGRPQVLPGNDAAEIRTDVTVKTRTSAQQGLPMVTGLEVGEIQEPDPNRPSLILCRVDAEQLWDVAKRCNSTVDAIRRINGIQDEPTPNQMLLIPVK